MTHLRRSRTIRKNNLSGIRVYSIGMFEHVGVRNYCHYFTVARRLPAALRGTFPVHVEFLVSGFGGGP